MLRFVVLLLSSLVFASETYLCTDIHFNDYYTNESIISNWTELDGRCLPYYSYYSAICNPSITIPHAITKYPMLLQRRKYKRQIRFQNRMVPQKPGQYKSVQHHPYVIYDQLCITTPTLHKRRILRK